MGNPIQFNFVKQIHYLDNQNVLNQYQFLIRLHSCYMNDVCYYMFI